MSYGLIVRNEFGDVLIHSDYEMFHLHSEEEFSTTAGLETRTLSFSGLNNQPIVLASVIDGESASLTCRAWQSSTLWDRVDIRIVSNESSKTIRVWIFARGEGGGGESYGIRVYRPDGSLSFDSTRKMVRFYDSFSGNVAINAVNNHDFTPIDYPPPVAINRRYMPVWKPWTPPYPHPPAPVYARCLHWKLVKNAQNMYYRLQIGLSDFQIALSYGVFGQRADAIDYSGFIFKYR